MKKLAWIALIPVISIFFISACGSNAYDINVSKLKTPCDFVDASYKISKEMYELRQRVGNSSPTQKQSEQMRKLEQKFTEMVYRLESMGYSNREFEREARKCRNFEKAEYYNKMR